MDEIQQKLNEVICSRLDELKTLDSKTKEYENTVDDIVALHKQMIEARKIELNSEESERSRKEQQDARLDDRMFKMRQLDDMKIDRRIKIAMFSTEIVATALFVIAGFKFEETGVFGSGTFKWIRDKCKLTKK